MKKKPSVRTSETKPERDPTMPASFPLTFDQWRKRPFMTYLTSWQANKGQFDKGARLFRLNEKEVQEFDAGSTKGNGNKHLRKTTTRAKRDALVEKINHGDYFPEVFRHCQNGDAEMTAALGNEAVWCCEHLFLLAEAGNPVAAKYLAEVAIKAAKGLERVAGNHYETLRGLAAIKYAWPVMTSPVKTLSSAPPDWAKLGLGAALNEGFLNKNRRVDLATPSGRLAWKLVNYIANLKHYYVAVGASIFAEDTIGKQAVALPNLTNDSTIIKNWWTVAELCLLESYPSLSDGKKIDEQNPVFAGIASARDCNTPDRHRNRILERLSGAFDSIAGYVRVKKTKPL